MWYLNGVPYVRRSGYDHKKIKVMDKGGERGKPSDSNNSGWKNL